MVAPAPPPEPPAIFKKPAGGSSPVQGAEDTPRSTWQQYEAKYGGQQTSMQTNFNGELRTVRLDNPVAESGILDFKNYDWSKSFYQTPFGQARVTEHFQNQIDLYQTIDPVVTFQFSQAPPSWVVSAIEQVGGKYTVAP